MLSGAILLVFVDALIKSGHDEFVAACTI